MINFKRLVTAQDYYEKLGYKNIDVPWEVESKIEKITKPVGLKSYKLNKGRLIASGEQGFLQLMKDGKLPNGMYQCTTPCFRDEVVDDLHKPYFMKVELIKVGPIETFLNLVRVIQHPLDFFSQYVKCKVIATGDLTMDIVTEKNEIELGSYGIRKHKLVGEWIYGTGLAEPRLTYVLENMG